ncbi:MAG: RNHCP domain-containing protein [Clostridia bacterium]|nr:RNHCP domain-containing protein [Clostridia bacterium]MBO7249968.1 RNHCP domain-containing protein [Clostridia bacterium]
METKRFSKNDSGFICAHCGKKVEPLGYTSRDHCPFCLWSIHIDVNPGDRANECQGNLVPIKAEPDPKRGFVIIYKCDKCGELHRNRAAHEAKVQPDNIDLLIRLTAKEI